MVAFNAAITVAAVMLIEYDQAGIRDGAPETSTLRRLDTDLEEASLALARVDYHNTMPEKCIKFIATLRRLLQGIRSSEYPFPFESWLSPKAAARSGDGLTKLPDVSRDAAGAIHPEESTIQATQGDTTVCGNLGGEQDMLASAMDYLHSNRHFQDLGSGDILASPEFTNSFGNNHLFW